MATDSVAVAFLIKSYNFISHSIEEGRKRSSEFSFYGNDGKGGVVSIVFAPFEVVSLAI